MKASPLYDAATCSAASGRLPVDTSLTDGSRIGVIGGAPAGSLFAYFALTFAQRMGLDLEVDVYEARDFTQPGPGGCNMCGGIVSESLIQMLATEGINLPPTVVQRGIDSYVLHTNESSVKMNTPQQEKRIAALHRGGGPRDASEVRWGGLDGYLLGLAQEQGARVTRARVRDVGWDDGRPQVRVGDGAQTYDLLVGATGVNSAGWRLYESLGFQSEPPGTSAAYITEVKLGQEAIARHFGSSMHVFLLRIPRLEFAAIIPKGEFATVCLLGDDIDSELVDDFFMSPAVRRCFPEDWNPAEGACHCGPRINAKEATAPFIDRVVLVGDAGVTRLYKDGIGAAYRTAKAAALTAVFHGVAADDFQKYYSPVYRSIARDNRIGRLMFAAIRLIRAVGPAVRGVMRMTAGEQTREGSPRRMTVVLWDMFTGSSSYRDVFFRTLDPRYWARFAWETVLSLPAGSGGKGE